MSTKTTKKRINITADADVLSAINSAAMRDGVLVTTKATELLRLALLLEEDLALANVADSRVRGNTNTYPQDKIKYISHESAWKKAR